MLRTRWLEAAAYSGMFGFGIVMAMLGAVLPFLIKRIGFDIVAAGTLFLPMNAAMLIMSFIIGPVLDRFGMKLPLIAGPVLVSAALLLMGSARSYSALVVSVLVLGIGGAALNNTTNTLVADLHTDPNRKNAALNLLGVFFGLGAIFVPFIIGALINQLGLLNIMWCAIALTLLSAVIAAVQQFPGAKQRGLNYAEMRRLAGNRIVLTLAFLLFFESGNEFILSGFTSTYLTREVHLADTTASYVLAGLWGSIIVARIASSRVLLFLKGESLIIASAIGTGGGVAILMAAHGLLVATIAVFVIGFSAAAIFPTALGIAAARFEKNSGSVFGILFSVGLLGGMSMPLLLGHLAAAFTLRTALLLVIVNTTAMALLVPRSTAAATAAGQA